MLALCHASDLLSPVRPCAPVCERARLTHEGLQEKEGMRNETNERGRAVVKGRAGGSGGSVSVG